MQIRNCMKHRKTKWTLVAFILLVIGATAKLHPDFSDFDDTVIYKIDFEYPDYKKEQQNSNLITTKTFYTHDNEKYECLIPDVESEKETKEGNEPELSPLTLLHNIFATASCSFRFEAYWSYEICHGHHVRQYHEEREGKNTKSQEFYLGKWSQDKTLQLVKTWEEQHKAGIKYKSTRIDNTAYPYYEMEYTDGTMCDIINEPRVTVVRYVCYPHGKNEIFSFKETSSCQYEAIVLTSVLCLIPAFHPEKTKEYSIKCFNSEVKTDTNSYSHKPLSLLRQEIAEVDDFPLLKDKSSYMSRAAEYVDNNLMLSKLAADKLLKATGIGGGVGIGSVVDVSASELNEMPKLTTKVNDISPLLEFISGKNCLTGGTGWWKYEFCYGRHVRQFHKDKKSETELFLGFFSEAAHRQWVALNPEKLAKRNGAISSTSLWHHYEKGTNCDRTGKAREVDIKLTCVPNSAASLAMYLLEPKTCQYILVVESSIICDLIQLADEYGLVKEDKLEKLLQQNRQQNDESGINDAPVSINDEVTDAAGSKQSVEQTSEMNIPTTEGLVDILA